MDHVGIDLGRRQSHAALLSEEGEVRYAKCKTSRAGFAKLLADRSGRVLIEASTSSEWVARYIESLGDWEVIVADPNYAPMWADRTRRIKTDRRDSEALMLACKKGNFRPAHRLSDVARAVRTRVQVRRALVSFRSSLVTHVRTHGARHGFESLPRSPDTFPDRWRQQEMPPSLADEMLLLEPMLKVASDLTKHLSGIDADLKRLGRRMPDVQRLMTVPRIGPVTATTWVGTLDRPDRFESGDQVACFIGLVPRVWSSSDMHRQGAITKKGPAELRCLLVEAAWGLFNCRSEDSAALHDWAQRVAARRGKFVAVVALARRLAVIMFAIWRDGTTFTSAKVGSESSEVAVLTP